MWKWLRSWFARRFSLVRLVVATVFLGAFAGLNARTVGPMAFLGSAGGLKPSAVYRFWGWPLPFIRVVDERPPSITDHDWNERVQTAWRSEPPFTHLAYHVLSSWAPQPGTVTPGSPTIYSVNCGAINALLALTVLTLILFLHPRRKPPDEAPA